MSCICGNNLVVTLPQIYAPQIEIYCNVCSLTISSTDVMYHCSRMSISTHPNGYDTCYRCYEYQYMLELSQIFKRIGTSCKSSTSSMNIINRCQHLQRLIIGLNIYQNLKATENKELLSSFSNEIYKFDTFIGDIKHFKCNHSDDNRHLFQIRQEMMSSSDLNFSDCKLSECDYSTRHFNREKNIISSITEDNSTDPFINFYSLQFDNLHFCLLHVFETGHRVISKLDENITEDDVNGNIDIEYLRISRVIKDSRNKFNRFRTASERNNNNKYMINTGITQETEVVANKDDVTFCDSMFNFMQNDKNILDKTQIENIRRFIIDNDYDSDSIRDDFEGIYFHHQTHSQSNFVAEFEQNESFDSVRQFLRKYKS